MTITEFLLDRIAEDEAMARAVADLGHVVDMGGNRLDERWYVSRLRFSSADGAARSEQDEAASALFARHDPARVLAECAAKRRIVDYREQAAKASRETGAPIFEAQLSAYDATLRALATVYADAPGFREEWGNV